MKQYLDKKINFVFQETNTLGVAHHLHLGLRDALKRNGLLHYSYSLGNNCDVGELMKYPVLFLRGYEERYRHIVKAIHGATPLISLDGEGVIMNNGKKPRYHDEMEEINKYFDVIFTLCYNDVNRYFGREVKYLNPFVAVDVMFPMEEPSDERLTFIGNLHGRDDFFKKLNVKINKYTTDQKPTMRENMENLARHMEKYFFLIAPPGRAYSILTGRPFEIMAMKRLCFCYDEFIPPGLFEDGVNVVTFHDGKELWDKYLFYKNNREKANEIAQRGYELVIRDHTTDVRAKQIVDHIYESIEVGV